VSSRLDFVLWVALPYLTIAVFAAGHVWRYRRDRFGWTAPSPQPPVRQRRPISGLMFHYGFFLVLGGHVIGILVPKAVTEFLGLPEHDYHLVSVIAATNAGVMMTAGFIRLPRDRRAVVPRHPPALPGRVADIGRAAGVPAARAVHVRAVRDLAVQPPGARLERAIEARALTAQSSGNVSDGGRSSASPLIAGFLAYRAERVAVCVHPVVTASGRQHPRPGSHRRSLRVRPAGAGALTQFEQTSACTCE
jgi:hypothetical protein